ncbi:hypothetical protein [Leptothoe kymatousa]|uniref:Uncharacterized protein n=1 Tax=Leptothoe kymatousa TAU-MAC 1615 TaxID=2364775 RepID=A0ABS5Y319_9CYAN|nr:hypothetical protein [Leptothoe kymatousa]MBT9312016.1 hypothetical protein [Leptothoe kymatousa TAU-MAC 1615]
MKRSLLTAGISLLLLGLGSEAGAQTELLSATQFVDQLKTCTPASASLWLHEQIVGWDDGRCEVKTYFTADDVAADNPLLHCRYSSETLALHTDTLAYGQAQFWDQGDIHAVLTNVDADAARLTRFETALGSDCEPLVTSYRVPNLPLSSPVAYLDALKDCVVSTHVTIADQMTLMFLGPTVLRSEIMGWNQGLCEVNSDLRHAAFDAAIPFSVCALRPGTLALLTDEKSYEEARTNSLSFSSKNPRDVALSEGVNQDCDMNP